MSVTKGPDSGPETIAVVGLGLMGGSLCRALKASDAPPRIIGLDTNAIEGTRALEAGAIDVFEMDAEAVVSAADVVVYATPLRITANLIGAHARLWRTTSLITDVVSLKAPILRAAASGGGADRFVGAHPICGGERSGFDAGDVKLFEGARIWLCAAAEVPDDLRERAEAFWGRVGGEPSWDDPDEHDRRMAWVSHLPQLVANALAGALDAAGLSPGDLGPGGRDMTRLAGSNPELWMDLLEVSAPVTGTGLTSVSNALNILADLLARREVDRIAEFMARTRNWRGGENEA